MQYRQKLLKQEMQRKTRISKIKQGSFFIGCMGAMVIAIALELPTGVHYAAALLFAGVCGALVALVPALLKVKWGVSELVTSIMFNYVVQFFCSLYCELPFPGSGYFFSGVHEVSEVFPASGSDRRNQNTYGGGDCPGLLFPGMVPFV